eukprot:TRINITY_DN17828_c0_g1_i1.p1 TRINITY_DN17828_c0_g1~~TRINITY_DN17828_c0_g1_i1.p1  ORF type:complete len:716 (+),score=181.97 TRINITY_DN17828_c0_g1_i1:63-2210(+)
MGCVHCGGLRKLWGPRALAGGKSKVSDDENGSDDVAVEISEVPSGGNRVKFARTDSNVSSPSRGGFRRRPLARRYTEAAAFGDGQAFDDVMAEFWPALKGFIEDFVLLGIVEPALRKHVWSRTKMDRCSLGNKPPRVYGAKSHRCDDDSHTVEIALDFQFDGDDVDICVLIDRGLRATMSQLTIKGTFCMELRNFLPELPLLTGMTLYFMNPPEVTVEFGGVLAHLEGRLISVKTIIERQLAAQLVVPNRLALHLSPMLNFDELRYPAPQGVFSVIVQGVTGLELPDTKVWPAMKLHLDVRLGADSWSTKVSTCNKDGEVRWDEEVSFCVDYPHGQSLLIELRGSTTFSRSSVVLGKARLSVAQVANATSKMETTWPFMVEDEDEEEDLSHQVANASIVLRGTHRPLFSGSCPQEGKGLDTLDDGSVGILVVVVDSVRDLPEECAGGDVECFLQTGDCVVETRRSMAMRMTQEALGQQQSKKLSFLLSGGDAGGAGDERGHTPEDSAWLLGLDKAKVSAIARGSLAASFNQQLRLRVKDPFKETLKMELRTCSRSPETVGTYELPLMEILKNGNWTLAMRERPFDGTRTKGPKFIARIQFLGAGAAEEHVRRGRYISEHSAFGGNQSMRSELSSSSRAEGCAVARRNSQRQKASAASKKWAFQDSDDERSIEIADADGPCTRAAGLLCGAMSSLPEGMHYGAHYATDEHRSWPPR